MKVKTDNGTFDVPEITFAKRRELHYLEVKAIDKSNKLNTAKFFDVLDWILNYCFTDPEKHLGHLDDNSIDEVLMAIYNQYKEPDKKK